MRTLELLITIAFHTAIGGTLLYVMSDEFSWGLGYWESCTIFYVAYYAVTAGIKFENQRLERTHPSREE